MFAFTPFDLFFYVVAIATVVSAFWVLFSKNIIHAAIGLLFTLFGVGGLYLMLASDFLGFLQLFIYIGATMVLIMFGIMLTRREEKGSEPGVPLTEKQASQASTYLGLFIAGAVFAFLFVILIVSGGDQWQRSAATNLEPPTSAIGEKLLTEYIYAFEIISVFLMVALIGAAYLARRRDVPEKTETTAFIPEVKINVKIEDTPIEESTSEPENTIPEDEAETNEEDNTDEEPDIEEAATENDEEEITDKDEEIESKDDEINEEEETKPEESSEKQMEDETSDDIENADGEEK